MKKTAFLLAFLMATAASGQKVKDTFDHEKFAKKVSMNLNLDMFPLYAREADLRYVTTLTGQTYEELWAQNEANKQTMKVDADYIIKSKIGKVIDKIELKIRACYQDPQQRVGLHLHECGQDCQ